MSGPHRETDENDQPRLDYYVEECQRLQRQYEATLEGKDAATARADTASAGRPVRFNTPMRGELPTVLSRS